MSAIGTIILTEKAAERAKMMLAKRGTAEAMIRIGVVSGGCSGYSYKLEYADRPEEGDVVIEQHGVRVVVDAKSMVFLNGTSVDFVSDPFRSGFKFGNPNEKDRCGCGESFKA